MVLKEPAIVECGIYNPSDAIFVRVEVTDKFPEFPVLSIESPYDTSSVVLTKEEAISLATALLNMAS